MKEKQISHSPMGQEMGETGEGFQSVKSLLLITNTVNTSTTNKKRTVLLKIGQVWQ